MLENTSKFPVPFYVSHSDETCFSLGRDAQYKVQYWSPVEEVWGKCAGDTNVRTPNRNIWNAWVLYIATVI